ncbi:DUF4114 domain-containing protein, partial [Crocosphaera watsonii]
NINILDNDNDIDSNINPESIVIITQPTNGALNINNDGTFTYTPNNNFNGEDSFTYTIEDEEGLVSNVATVDVIVNGTPQKLEPLTEGIFVVGQNGQFSIDILIDAGGYEGELGVFSMEGMDNLNPGSSEFIQEAVRRSLSNSILGYRVFSDRTQGAKFSGELGEIDRNEGIYNGKVNLTMPAGTKFVFLLVPNGTLEDVVNNANLSSDIRPLFSWASANINNTKQMGQLLAEGIGGKVFGFEDLAQYGGSDNDFNDFNDLIFQVEGAYGQLTVLQRMFAPQQNWENTSLGQELIDYAIDNTIFTSESQIILESNNKTLTINDDLILKGRIFDLTRIIGFQATLREGSGIYDLLSYLQSDGSFEIKSQELSQKLQAEHNSLGNQTYTLLLEATNELGEMILQEVVVVFEIIPPVN